jgi:hypothetical protein
VKCPGGYVIRLLGVSERATIDKEYGALARHPGELKSCESSSSIPTISP